MTRLIKAEKPFFAFTDEEGNIIGVGDGAEVRLSPDTEVLWFDSFRDRETDKRVQDWQREQVDFKQMLDVESEKSDAEYIAKAEESGRWLRGNPTDDIGDFTPANYPFMALEVAAKSITPRECAESIRQAIERTGDDSGPLEKARKRIAKREKFRGKAA